MYTSILIPTDGSELAGKAIQHGIALAKRIGAKITVLTVLPPFHTFTTDTQMIEDTPAQYKAGMQEHAEKNSPAPRRTNQHTDRSVSSAARRSLGRLDLTGPITEGRGMIYAQPLCGSASRTDEARHVAANIAKLPELLGR